MKRCNISLLLFLFFISCRHSNTDSVLEKDNADRHIITNDPSSAEPEIAAVDRPGNVIVVVIDGPRYSETWGEPTSAYMPNLGGKLRHEGTLFTNFYNTGFTETVPGHTAICTGVNQQIKNSGNEVPQYPSMFQHWLEQTQKPASSAWLITSKDKLSMLAKTLHPEWSGKYSPSVSCGNDGVGQDYRSDIQTLNQVKSVLSKQRPNLVLVNFKEPDVSAHANNWRGYIKGIKDTDAYVASIWKFIQDSDHYRDNTVLLITNDHGRHLDSHQEGFRFHGDNCSGCRHISLFAIGKNIQKGKQVHKKYDQRDIPVTIAKMLNFRMIYAKGKVIKELLPERSSKGALLSQNGSF